MMGSFIRGAVSKKKRRYQKNGFDLDLTYVTPRIVAMGFPSENVEAAYRNPMKEVLRFLDSFHKDHYRVYNLCSERGYDSEKFYNRVAVFPFDDHNAPPFEMILQFCRDVEQWLQQDEKNIAVIHCKAGKGRTGLMISAWMVYSREWATAKDALTFYAAMRTYNQKGVTIPSQIRYVHYFEESLRAPVETKTLLLNRITFYTIPKVAHIPDINFHVHVGKTLVFTYKDYEAKLKPDEAKKRIRKSDEEDTVFFECGNVPLRGDVKVEFNEKSSKLFAFWFCASFVKANRLVLTKEELDKAHKDSSHKSFHQNFRVELVFSELSSNDQALPPSAISDAVPSSSSSGDASLSSTSSASPASSPSELNGFKNIMETHDSDKALTDQSPGVPLSSVLTGEWVLNKDLIDEENVEPEDANEFSERLLTLLLQACKAGVREGWLIETHTHRVRASPEFREFQRLVPRLANVLLTGLPPYSAIAFWLNVHNMLMVHSRVLLTKHPKKKEGVLALHQTARYRVGGRVYSASDMEVGVLRAACTTSNETPFVGATFDVADARRVYQLLQHEPRITFALYHGTESCPPVAVYSHKSLIQDLDAAAKHFLEMTAFSDYPHKDVWLPKLLSWHRMEFGPKDLGLKEVVRKYLKVALPEFSLKYNQFTWEFKMLPWYVEEERQKAEKLERERRKQAERVLLLEREKRAKKEKRHTNSHHRDTEASDSKRDRDQDREREHRKERKEKHSSRDEKSRDRERDRDRRDKEKERDDREKGVGRRDKETDKENRKERRRSKSFRDLERVPSKQSVESARRSRLEKRKTVTLTSAKPEDKSRERHKDREEHRKERRGREKGKDRDSRSRKDMGEGVSAKDIGEGVSAKESRRMSL